jgi:hypothetical protein
MRHDVTRGFDAALHLFPRPRTQFTAVREGGAQAFASLCHTVLEVSLQIALADAYQRDQFIDERFELGGVGGALGALSAAPCIDGGT